MLFEKHLPTWQRSLWRKLKGAYFNAEHALVESLHLKDSCWYPGPRVITSGKVEQIKSHTGVFGFRCVCGCHFWTPARKANFVFTKLTIPGDSHLLVSYPCPECHTEVVYTLGSIESVDPSTPTLKEHPYA